MQPPGSPETLQREQGGAARLENPVVCTIPSPHDSCSGPCPLSGNPEPRHSPTASAAPLLGARIR